MQLPDYWDKALAETVILRSRVQSLETFKATWMPYVLLSSSEVNVGDTVTRKGAIRVERPAIFLPNYSPQLDGFRFDETLHTNAEMITNMLLVRGVSLPSLKYFNKTDSMEIFEGDVEKASRHFQEMLQKREDVQTALVVGPEDCWQLSLLIFVAGQVARCAPGDFRRIMERFREDSLS